MRVCVPLVAIATAALLLVRLEVRGQIREILADDVDEGLDPIPKDEQDCRECDCDECEHDAVLSDALTFVALEVEAGQPLLSLDEDERKPIEHFLPPVRHPEAADVGGPAYHPIKGVSRQATPLTKVRDR